SSAAGIDVGTLNAWISRGYVSGITANAQGRRRDFGIETATQIAIMWQLSRFGIGAPLASKIASVDHKEDFEIVVITPPLTQPHPTESGTSITNMRTIFLKKTREVLKTLAAIRESGKEQDQPAPTIIVLVDIKTLAIRMRAAEK